MIPMIGTALMAWMHSAMLVILLVSDLDLGYSRPAGFAWPFFFWFAFGYFRITRFHQKQAESIRDICQWLEANQREK